MEVLGSAFRHDVDEPDIQHAVVHAVAVEEIGDDPLPRALSGPGRAGKPARACREWTTRRGGRDPRDGDAPAVPAAGGDGDEHTRNPSERLDPELKRDLLLRAAQEQISVSELIRHALRQYLRAG